MACLLLSHSGAGLTALLRRLAVYLLWYIGVPSPFRAIVWRCVCIYINTDTWSWKCVSVPIRSGGRTFLCSVSSPLAGYSFAQMCLRSSDGHSTHWRAFSFLHSVCGGTSSDWGEGYLLSIDSPSACLLLSDGGLGDIPLMFLPPSDFSIADVYAVVNGFPI